MTTDCKTVRPATAYKAVLYVVDSRPTRPTIYPAATSALVAAIVWTCPSKAKGIDRATPTH